MASIFLFLAAIVAVGVMVAWPRLKPPRRIDDRRAGRRRLSEGALGRRFPNDQDDWAPSKSRRRSARFGSVTRNRQQPTRSSRARSRPWVSFTPGSTPIRLRRFDRPLHAQERAWAPLAETLDKLHEAKDDAEKSGLYKKMQSGDPDEMFDAAEQFGKVFTQLAEGALAPKKILPTYKMLVEESKPPLPEDAKALALEVADATKDWDALLKRSFHTLKADGPFIFERAEVLATATDRLASSAIRPAGSS